MAIRRAAIVFLILVIFGAALEICYVAHFKQLKELFRVNLPADFKEQKLSRKEQDFWGNPRYQFRVTPAQFQKLTLLLKNAGYPAWIESGGQFGLFNQDSTKGDPLLMSLKIDGRSQLMFFYRPSTGILDAVSFFN